MKAIRTFCFPHQGHRVWHPCAQPQHMFSRKYDDPQLKKKKKKMFVLHSCFPNAVQAIKTALPLPHDKDGVWYEKQNPSIY